MPQSFKIIERCTRDRHSCNYDLVHGKQQTSPSPKMVGSKSTIINKCCELRRGVCSTSIYSNKYIKFKWVCAKVRMSSMSSMRKKMTIINCRVSHYMSPSQFSIIQNCDTGLTTHLCSYPNLRNYMQKQLRLYLSCSVNQAV